MPAVLTLSGSDESEPRKKHCKRVRLGKSGKTIEVCLIGSGDKKRWTFMKGTAR